MPGVFGISAGKRWDGCLIGLLGRKKVCGKMNKNAKTEKLGRSKRNYVAYGTAFFLLAAAVYLECCVTMAYIWAGFNGFGGIWMEYNEKGEAAGAILGILPCLLLVGGMVWRVIRHVKRKEPVRRYLYDVLFLMAGIAAGIVSFYVVPEPRQTMIYAVMEVIRSSGWLEYPAG